MKYLIQPTIVNTLLKHYRRLPTIHAEVKEGETPSEVLAVFLAKSFEENKRFVVGSDKIKVECFAEGNLLLTNTYAFVDGVPVLVNESPN